MSLLTEAEAAIKIGYSIELLKHFTKKCPKSGEDTLLKSKVLDGQTYYDEKDLNSYHAYLNKLWPLPPKGTRPTIPEAIKDDVKRESSYSCAICGHMDNGEVAHINAVAHSLNNAPDNLLFLCPNHHTKYDLGFKPDSNLTPEVIKAAKVLKRNSRQRILRYEANATKLLYTLIASLREVENQIKNARSKDMVAVLTTEMMELVYAIPGAVKEAQEYASADLDLSKTEKLLIKNSGNIAKLISQKSIKESEQNLRTTASSVLSLTSQIVIDIDEVECPHCAGRGQTGYAGDICAYCHGSCVVSHKKVEAYDREQIDEVDCPHCGGRGQTGLVGDICAYCHGSCVVSNAEAEAYNREQIDEVDCPHCEGRGQIGLFGDVCAYCHGSCVVSHKKAEAYDREQIDEVDCPHCGGRGQTGLVGDVCALCKGSCVVSNDVYQAYIEKCSDR